MAPSASFLLTWSHLWVMRCFYGDGSPCGLNGDFLALVRDVIDFAVLQLQSQRRIDELTGQLGSLKASLEREIARLYALEQAIGGTLTHVCGEDTSPTMAGCAESVMQVTTAGVRLAVAELRARVDAAARETDAQAAEERKICGAALADLLRRHTLPDPVCSLLLEAQEDGTYAAREQGATSFGLEWVAELDIPRAHRFGRKLRVRALAPTLAIHAPTRSGWFHRRTRLRRRSLAGHYVAALHVAPNEMRIHLRSSPMRRTGFNITLFPELLHARVSRIGKSGQPIGLPFVLSEADAQGLLSFGQKLAKAALELSRYRKSVVSVRVDGQKLEEHDAPTTLARRLIERIAPAVRELARRSSSPGEVVLRQVFPDDRREEVFFPAMALVERWSMLPVEERAVFESLGLEDEVMTLVDRQPSDPVMVALSSAREDEPTGPFETQRPGPSSLAQV